MVVVKVRFRSWFLFVGGGEVFGKSIELGLCIVQYSSIV